MSIHKARACGMSARIYIGFSSDGAEIIATYLSRREADELRQPGEIVTGPWMRVPRATTAPKTSQELRALRKRRRWTQADAARHFGVHRRTIMRAEAHRGTFSKRMALPKGGA